MTRTKLVLQRADGTSAGGVTDQSLQIIFDSLIGEDESTKATKLMIAMCLYGLEHEISQDLIQETLLASGLGAKYAPAR